MRQSEQLRVPSSVRVLCTALQPANCFSIGSGLFLNRVAVLRHIAASNPCFEEDLGSLEIQVEARAGDVMAGAGGTVGPAPDV